MMEGSGNLKKKTVILMNIFLFTFLFGYVFFHEATHVALNEFRVDGACVLNCKPMDSVGIFGNNYTPVGVYLSHPINPIAKNETIAHVSGILVSFIFSIMIINIVSNDNGR